MRKPRDLFVLLILISLLILPAASSPAQDFSSEPGGEEAILVGRISHVEGSVYRYIPEEGAWVQVAMDSPFGLEDKLRSDRRSRAEVILPNNTWFRMDGETRLHLLSLQTDGTEMHMVHGSARFMNKGSLSTIYVSTPFGEVHAPAQTSFDIHVSDSSMEVVALKGSVYFTGGSGRTKFEVAEDSASLIADRYAVTAGQGYRDSPWNAWNLQRDALWAKRMGVGGASAKYLPPTLHDHAYALDHYGVWQRVYYDGAYGYLWRPLYVAPGWAPYTEGRWDPWYGDHVWISREPFGYVTHHYGTWVYNGGYWFWAPPVTAVSIHFVHPSLRIGLAWYPGRVAWFHVGTSIGWIPLAPYEPYYAHRRWGPRTVVVKNVTVVNVNVRSYRHERHAVMIDKRKLHTTDNYRTASIRTVDRRTLGARIQAQPMINQRQAVRNPGRDAPLAGNREMRRPSQSPVSIRNTTRRDVPPRNVGGQGAAGATGNRIIERRPDSSSRTSPALPAQQRSIISRGSAADTRSSTLMNRDNAPQRNTGRLPASPRLDNRNRQNPAPSRPSPTAPQIETRAPRTSAPAPAGLRPAPERRSSSEAGAAFRTLPQQGRRGLEGTRPEADRAPNARFQRERALPDDAQPGNRQNITRGRPSSR